MCAIEELIIIIIIMIYIVDDATQLVGHSGKLLNENTAF